MDRKFKVIENEKRNGLTVGSYSRKPGYVFDIREWSGSIESLEAAIDNGRCVEITAKEEKEEKEEKKESKKSDKKSKREIKSEIKNLEEKYVELDSESEEAQNILEEIEKLKGEL